MPRVPLLGGSYRSASLIANAQRCVNLYPEVNPETSQAPVSITHFKKPGNVLLSSPPAPGRARCLYCTNVGAGADTSAGDLYAVIDQAVYYIDPNWTWTLVGSTLTPGSMPAYMADNGATVLMVDGSLFGYQIDIPTRAFSQIGDPNFLGGDRIDFCDSFLVINQPNTANWYCTDSQSAAFNALSFGTKTTWPDNIVALVMVGREIWLIGPRKTEIAYNAGTTPFPFQTSQGQMPEHGAASRYSLCKQDIFPYWLSASPEGARMMMKGAQHAALRISNHAVEQEWKTYARVDDVIGSAFQVNGHAFVQFDFPTADRTWMYDEATKQFWENAWFDSNGLQHRSRASFYAFAYGRNLALNWATGDLYEVDPNTYTDAGSPITCIRSLPHLMDDEDDRVTYNRAIADIETGGTPDSAGANISLRVSRDRGGSWGNPLIRPMGAAGEYLTRPTWNRLGYSTDAVLELSWTSSDKTSLNGVFVSPEPHVEDSDYE